MLCNKLCVSSCVRHCLLFSVVVLPVCTNKHSNKFFFTTALLQLIYILLTINVQGICDHRPLLINVAPIKMFGM